MTKPSELLSSPPYGEMLVCHSCWDEFSAYKGDYWDRADQKLECNGCGELLDLVVKSVRYDPVDRDSLLGSK